MQISMHEMTIGSFVPALSSLSALLDKGAAYAKANDRDLSEARLADDMFPLPLQVQLACNRAVDSACRLIGKPVPPFSNTDNTPLQLKKRIANTIAFLQRIEPGAFDGAEARDCSIEPPNAGIVIELNGLQLLRAWALPDFYFHIVTAYDILRHMGVEIGKRDYMSWIGPHVRPCP